MLRDTTQRSMAATTLLAFDIGGTRIKAGVLREGTLLTFETITLPDRATSSDLLTCIRSLGTQLMAQHDVAAIGIAIRGIVDAQAGTVMEVNGPLSTMIGQPLATMIAAILQRPTSIENDARMYALGELLDGAGQGCQNLLCLTLGTGVGCSVALNGRMLRGERGVGGILGGHMTIQADGPQCSCGNRGCLEAYIGSEALQAEVRAVLMTEQETLLRKGSGTPQDLFIATESGDALAQQIVQRFITYLGAGIVSLIHVYDPDRVVIGGGIAHATAQFLPEVQAYVDTHAWTLPRRRVQLVPALLGDAAALFGLAAWLRNPSFCY